MTARIPEATVGRLPVYLRALLEAAESHILTLSSEALAERTGVNAAQVRKDLSHLGSFGTRGVGYDVEYLVAQITRHLGLTQDRRVAIVGIGNLGQALAHYRGFPARGFRVVAAFDADPEKVGRRIGDTVVHHVNELAEMVRRERIVIGLIATPPGVAQGVADRLVAAGVTSILNFAPTLIRVPDHVAVRKVDLAIELQILSYYEQASPGGDSSGGTSGGHGARAAENGDEFVTVP